MSPFPNEHACRLKDPGGFQEDSFRRIKRDNLVIIIGRPKGQTTTTAQAYRYPTGDYSRAEAAAHCKEAGGSFEAATGEKETGGERMTVSQGVRSLVKWILGSDEEFDEWMPAVLSEKQQDYKTEDGIRFRRTDYAVRGEADTPTTWKLRLAESRSGDFTVAQIARAITAMQPGGFRGQRVELEAGERAEAVRNISAAIGKVGDDEQKENLRERLAKVKALEGGFKVLKHEGKRYWIARTTNAFEDAEHELFSTEALEGYVAQADKGIPPEVKTLLEKAGLPATEQGELWLAHIPGSRIGAPLWKAVEGRFLLEVGEFDDTPMGKAAAEHFSEQGDEYRVSHGYLYRQEDKETGIYNWLWKFETSPLPAGWEANPWTGIEIIAKESKQMDQKKKDWLVTTFGEALANDIIAKAQSDSKALEELGVLFKEGEKPETEPETTPEHTEAFVLEKDGKAMEALVEAVTEKLAMKELTDGIAALTKRIEAIEKADKPLVVLGRGFRASQSESTVVSGDEVPEGATPEGEHMLDKIKRRR